MKSYMSTDKYDLFGDESKDLPDQPPDQSAPPQPSGSGIAVTPEAALIEGAIDITKETIRCFTEYAKVREHEVTERKRIAATLRAIKYKTDAQKEMYLKELSYRFDERNRLYDLAEKAQEKALECGDMEMLRLCYDFILNIYNRPVGMGGSSFLTQNERVLTFR